MKHNVPIRKMETFVSEDGRKVDKLTLYNKIETDINTLEEIEFKEEDVLFIGYEPMDEVIEKPYSERERVKFPIKGVETIEDAFDKYIEIWQKVSKCLSEEKL